MSKRLEKMGDVRRMTILEATLSVVAREGIEGASISQICELAGVSKGFLFYYFDGREDLVATAARFASDQFMQKARTLPIPSGREEFWDFLSQVYRMSFAGTYLNSECLAFLGQIHRAAQKRPLPDSLKVVQEEMEAYALNILAKGQELGAVRVDLPQALLASAFLALLPVVDVWTLSEQQRGADPEQTLGPVLEVIRSLLSPRLCP